MKRSYGSQSMVGRLARVLVRRPDAAFGSADPTDWHYAGRPDLEAARREHQAFVRILDEAGAEVLYHDDPGIRSADAIFTHDPCVVTDAGAILLRMGKPLRRDEPAAMGETLRRIGVPIRATLEGSARAEGGDLLWLDRETLAVGQGPRTNAEGLSQLEEALRPLGVRVIPVELPVQESPDACLHLMSLVSLLDHDLAVIHRPMLPAAFHQLLEERGFGFVEIPEREFETLGANVLALAPRDCLMLDANPVTRERLQAAGCRVRTYPGEEISLKAEGGATCLTRPILREP